MQGERLDLHYIVGVCTKKAEQGKGYMGQLVTEALRICKEDGEPFTVLMPAAEAIYRPYDFVSAGWCDKFVIEAEEVEEADPSLPQARWDAIVPELGQAGSIQNVGNHTLQICPFDRWTAGQTKQLESFAAELPMDMHAAWTAAYFAETDETVNKKIKSAFANDLKPIVCVGESLEQRKAGKTEEVITKQVELALAGLTEEQVKNTIIAYEPIWAIGTGKTATSEDANNSIKAIRKKISEIYGNVAEDVIIQYGGSVKSTNAKELFETSDIDGALVGGASLKVDEFAKIVNYNK